MFLILSILFQKLLEVVHDLFEEQTSIEQVVVKIMTRAQSLLKCENAAVLLIDETSSVSNKTLFFDFLTWHFAALPNSKNVGIF